MYSPAIIHDSPKNTLQAHGAIKYITIPMGMAIANKKINVFLYEDLNTPLEDCSSEASWKKTLDTFPLTKESGSPNIRVDKE